MATQETTRVNGSPEKLKETGEKMIYEIKDAGKQAWNATKDTLDEAKHTAEDAYQSGKKIIKDNVGEYSSIVDDVEKYLRENPIKSFFIGIGAIAFATRLTKKMI